MVAVYEATSGNADTSRQAAVLDAPDATYSLLYFDSQGICNPLRNLLSMGNATWKQLYSQDWDNEDKLDKTSTPFEVTPVLYVHAKDGSETVALSECKPIELYLAKKFNALGRNSFEQALIMSFVSSTASLFDDFMYSVAALQATPEVKQEQIALFFKIKVPKWIRIHEEHLRANGSNGHYVGDQVSLADLRSADLVDMILQSPMAGGIISEETTPGLLKVKAAVDTHPAIVQWRDTELFKSLRPTRGHPPRPHAACTGLNDRKGNKQGP